MRFTSFFPGYRTRSCQYQLNSPGSIQPCCHHGAGNYSNTRAITVQPGTHSLLDRESAHTGEVSCARTRRHPAAAETRIPETSQSQVAGHSHRSVTPCIYGIYILDIGTPEGGHCQGTCRPQWFFYVPLNVSETAPPFTWSCEPWEIHSLQRWRTRRKLCKPLPCAAGIEPGAAAWQAHTPPLALLLPSCCSFQSNKSNV